MYEPLFYSRGWGLLHLTDSDLNLEFFSLFTRLFLKRVTLATSQWLCAGLSLFQCSPTSRGWGLLLLTDSELDLEFFNLLYLPVFSWKGWPLLLLTDSELDIEYFSAWTIVLVKMLRLATSIWLSPRIRIFQFINVSFSEKSDPCYFSRTLS